MSITTFAGFLDQLTRLLDGDEVSASDVNTATLRQIVSLGERRIYREVRSRHNEKAFDTVLTSNNAATLPLDFEASSVVHFGGQALEPVPEEFILEYGTYGAGHDPRYFAEAGPSLIFAPQVADNSIVQGRYFYRLPDLDETTLPSNSLFLNETDLFIYGCLSAGSPFYSQSAKVPIWEAQYQFLKNTINENKTRSAYSAGRIQQRPSSPMLRRRSPGRAVLGTGGLVQGYLALDGLVLSLDGQQLGLV